MTTPVPGPNNQGLNALSKYGINISGGSSVTSSGPGVGAKVYMGPNAKRTKVGPLAPRYGPYAPGQEPGVPYLKGDTADYNQAIGTPMNWDESQKRDFISKGILYKMPGFSANMGQPEIMDAWKSLVDSSVEFTQQSGQKWSPYDVMASYATDDKNFGTIRKGDWLYDARTGEKIKYVGPKNKTTVAKNVNLSSAEDVRALTTQMLTELLGRAPTTEELAKYRASINGYEEKNPEIATTTQTFNDQGEAVSQSTTTTGGASQAALGGIVEQGAKKGPEYSKYQSGTTYFNALMQMIAGG